MKRNTLLKRALFGLLAGFLFVTLLTLLRVPVSGYLAASLVFAAFVLTVEAYGRKRYRNKKKELQEIDEFLSAVRHEFHIHGMVDEAVRDASVSQKSRYIREEADKILDVLEAEDVRAAAKVYRMSESNRYLKLFVTLCVTVSEYGDKTTKDGSMFLNNIMNLKEELRLEAEADELLAAKTAGICPISAAPAFCLKLIENWSVGNLPEMSGFYSGQRGVTVLASVFTLAVTVYCVNCLLRSPGDTAGTKGSIFEKVKIPKHLTKLFYRAEKAFAGYSAYQARLLAKAGTTLSVGRMYLAKTVPALTVLMVAGIAAAVSKVTGEAVPSPAFAAVLVLLCFAIPDILLMVRAMLNRMKMDEEVMQYQTIISMLANIEFISIYDILEELEHFAIIFKRNISNCLNDYTSGEEGAIEELGRSGNALLKRLSERLVMCDRIGVKDAMDELAADRDYYFKTRERKTAENVKKRAVMGQFLAFIPLIAAVALYLIIPFAAESVRLLADISSELGL